jgi:hypothetical protein
MNFRKDLRELFERAYKCTPMSGATAGWHGTNLCGDDGSFFTSEAETSETGGKIARRIAGKMTCRTTRPK